MDIVIPDIGDAQDVEVIEICVSAGDAVGLNDALIVIESDKASMEVPAPAAGTVSEVLVALGDLVNEGDRILVLDAAPTAEPPAPGGEAAPAVAPVGLPDQPAPGSGELEELIGELDQLIEADVPDAETGPSAGQADGQTASAPDVPSPVPAQSTAASKIYAGPAVRRLARELGVDLAGVSGSGARGRIVKDDVKSFVKNAMTSPSSPAAAVPAIDFSRFGEIEEVPLGRIRARGAANLARSWAAVVHVTQHDDADVTDLEAFRASLREEAASRGAKLTPLPLIMKACAANLTAHPRFNASLDATVSSLILKRYMNIGFAVDTEDGLVVPVVRDAGARGVWQLAEEIERLSVAAREKSLRPDDLQGGCFTISSLGAIGGTGFTPVVNAPEVAILGVARLATRPVWDGEAFVPRKMLPLSLSYDHRALNGAEAGRFMSDLVSLLGDFRRLAL